MSKRYNKSVVILAGGKGSRMGYTDKAFLEYENKPFVEHVLEKVRDFDEIIIVSNNPEKYRNYTNEYTTVIEDLVKNIGPLGGIYTGLKNIKNDTTLVVSCDTPFLNQAFINYLGEVEMKSDISIPRYKVGEKNRREPLCSLYKKDILPLIENNIEAEQYKVACLFDKLDVKWIELNKLENLGLDQEEIIAGFNNINTPNDLKKVGGNFMDNNIKVKNNKDNNKELKKLPKKQKKTNIFIEEAIDLIVNGRKLLTFMCSPENIDDLALGYLYAKGLIDSVEEYMGSGTCESGSRLFVLVGKQLPEEAFATKPVIMSGCGSGELPKGELFVRNKTPNHTETMSNIKTAFVEMLTQADLHRTKGGTHSAAILDNKGNTVVREDIGRHNAVDKAIGAALKMGLDLTKSVVMTTGRTSSDMTVKALGAGIPIVSTMRITSNLAIEIGSKYGALILGRIGSDEPIVYNYVDNIDVNLELDK